MSRIHAVAVAALLAAAAAAGLYALARTVGVGATASASPQASDAAIARRSRALDRMEASLRRSLDRRPPALPAVPPVRAAAPPSADAPSAPVVRYVRPAPVVVRSTSGHGDDEHEAEHGDAGGEADD